MTLRLYMDVHVRRAVTIALRLRGVDVMTAQEDRASRLDDPQLLLATEVIASSTMLAQRIRASRVHSGGFSQFERSSSNSHAAFAITRPRRRIPVRRGRLTCLCET